MAAWLGRFAAAFLPTILEWVYGKGSRAIREWLAARQAEKAVKDEAARVREQTERAQTQEERNAAAEAARRNF